MIEIVWQYWFRVVMENNTIKIEDLTRIIIEYYNIGRVLKWREKLKSRPGFKFIDDDRCVKRFVEFGDTDDDAKWIFPDIEPVNEGIHCWRVNVNFAREGAEGGWVLYAVAPPDPNMPDNGWAQSNPWGVAYSNYYVPTDKIQNWEKCVFEHLYQKHLEVDILLDLEEGTVKIGIVGKIDDEHEYRFKGIEKTNEFGGWAPHFNSYYSSHSGPCSDEVELRIAEIPPELYGETCTIF